MTGDNSLLNKIEDSAKRNKDSEEEEKVKLAVMAAKLSEKNTIVTNSLNNELRSIFDDNSIVVEEKTYGWLFKRNKAYMIHNDGSIEIEDIDVANIYSKISSDVKALLNMRYFN